MNNPKMWGINWIVSIVMLFLNIRNKLTITYNNPNAMKAFSVFRQIEYFKPDEHYLKSISSRFPFYLKFKLYQLPKLSLTDAINSRKDIKVDEEIRVTYNYILKIT